MNLNMSSLNDHDLNPDFLEDPMGEELRRKSQELIDAQRTIEHLELKVQSLIQDKSLLIKQCEMLENAGDSTQYQAELLARLNHELRTPLNSIIGFANLLLCDPQASRPELEKNFLSRIVENGKSLNEKINRMLDLASIEAGTIELEYSAVDVAELIDALTIQWKKRSESSGVSFHWEKPQGSAPYPTDRSRLNDVLNYLLNNAVKFTPEGSITVELDLHEQSGWPDEIRILDTGIGVSDETEQSVFEAFRQCESGTSRSFEGLGLGLSLSASLSRMLGIELTLESRPDGGTCARLRFPETSTLSTMMDDLLHLPTSEPIRTPQPSACQDKHVLILSANLDLQILVTQQIQRGHGHVIQALNARDAREFLQSGPVDLLLLDPLADSGMAMTVLEGWHEAMALPPVILLCDRPEVAFMSDYPVSGNIGAEDLHDFLLPMISAVFSPEDKPGP